jgi:hypothetical protein
MCVPKMPISAFEAKCGVPGNAELIPQSGQNQSKIMNLEAIDSAFFGGLLLMLMRAQRNVTGFSVFASRTSEGQHLRLCGAVEAAPS